MTSFTTSQYKQAARTLRYEIERIKEQLLTVEDELTAEDLRFWLSQRRQELEDINEMFSTSEYD